MRRQSDNIDKAEEGLRELADYDDWDEPTENRVVVENHMHLESLHDSDPPAKRVRAGLVAVGSGIGIALLTGIAALLQHCGH